MAFLEAYFAYMCGAAVVAVYLNIVLLWLVPFIQFPAFPGFDILLYCQATPAVFQLILLVLLCPRTLFDDDLFVVSFHGLAELFNINSKFQLYCFAVLVFLAINTVVPIAVSFSHRLWAIKGVKVSGRSILWFLVIGMLPQVVVMIRLMCIEDWKDFSPEILDHNNTTEEVKRFAYNTTTWSGLYVMVVTVGSPLIVYIIAVYVFWEAKQVMPTMNISEANKRMHETLLQSFFVQASIPSIIALVVLVWFFSHKQFSQIPKCFECFLFGVGPLVLCCQVLLTVRTIGRYQRVFGYPFCVLVALIAVIVFILLAII